jgi:O-antigen/teichoic acid export membrane protein
MIAQLAIGSFVMSLMICVPLSIFAPQVIGFLLGPAYLGATAATRILMWFLPMAVVGAPLLALLAGTGHAADNTKVFALAFAVAILMHVALDHRFGAVGGAIASVSRDPFALAASLLLARRRGLMRQGKPWLALLRASVSHCV